MNAGGFSGVGLTCVRGERIVFANLDFILAPGGALLLLGPNGSGKSSLLRVMAGLSPPAAGRLLWRGEPVRRDREGHGARTRYIGHHDAIKPALTVRENIAFWVRQWAPEIADAGAAVHAAAARFDMERLLDAPGAMLSAGQKRRAALARLLAAPAPLWLLDEPATALDEDSTKALERAVADHRANGGMVALSTHGDLDAPQAKALRMDEFAATMAALEAQWTAAEV